MKQTIELNIALLPTPELGDKLTDLSERLAQCYPAIIRLGRLGSRLTMAPHLTLYQTPMAAELLPEADAELTAIASRTSRQPAEAIGYTYNGGEGSFEVRRKRTAGLVGLQEATIGRLNPLRGGQLLARDPAGNSVAELATQSGQVGDNIRATGYAETGPLFRPHDTTNWFELGTQVDISRESLPDLSELNGDYRAIGMFVLGPYGTCPQLLAEYDLRGY